MFTHPADVVRALERFRDCYDPRSGSLMLLGGRRDPHREPFRNGFIAHFEERTELVRRLARLDERSQRLLLLWHVEAVPVAEIARRLGISRMHCYRLARRAFAAMIDASDDRRDAVAANG